MLLKIAPLKNGPGGFAPLLLGILLVVTFSPSIHAVVNIPGLASSQIDPELKGQVLIEELNCAACHAGDSALKARSKKAPRLSDVGSRVNPGYLESFILNPHGTKPGTTMPDVLASLGAAEKQQAARELTHFLLSLKPNDFSLQPPDAVAAQHGKRLFHSRGCAACHSPRDDKGTELLAKNSVPLGALDRKYSFKSLVEFLRQPHASRPSGRMPDLRLPGRELERIAHYLLQDTRVPGHLNYTLYRGDVWEGLASDKVTAERAGQVKDFDPAPFGKLPQHTALMYEGWFKVEIAGTYRFFLTLNGGSLEIGGRTVAKEAPSDRRGVKSLEAVVELDVEPQPLRFTYFHTGREARLKLEVEGPGLPRGPIPADMLSVSKEPIPAFEPLKVDAGLAARGRERFANLGCANCHDDLKVPAKSVLTLTKLDASRGCLSEGSGPWPRYDLTAEQRGWITKALPRVEHAQLDEQQRLNKTLVTFNCIACHERAGVRRNRARAQRALHRHAAVARRSRTSAAAADARRSKADDQLARRRPAARETATRLRGRRHAAV